MFWKTLLSVTLVVNIFTLFGQEEQEHSCSHNKISKKQAGGEKTLTVNEEVEANKYDVHYYALDLSMSNLNTNISGTASIHGTTIENLDSVILELYPTMIITEVRLNGIPTTYNRTNSILKIPINASSGFSFIIDVDYGGTPPTPSNNPFGGSGVTNANVSSIGQKVTWTVSCPFLAHEWFPCKQILKDKADSSSVKITVPSAMKAGSNGVLENVVDLGNGTTRYEWKHRHPILYYLIFASVAPYTEYSLYAHPSQLVGDSVLIQNYIYGNASGLATITTQCDLLPGFLELYSDKYGLYPFSNEKYGINVAPLSGGMEHQTMSTIGVFEKKITAHELAHQWFGDHVGIASFSDVWLSEGFATYSEYVMLEAMYPAEKAALVSGWHSSVLAAINGSVWHTDTLDIARIYNSRLTYKKGASIVHTLRHIVNNDVLFFQTLRDFQQVYHDSVAVGLDLKSFFESSTGIDLTNFFEEWYFGEGYPTYSARWNAMGNDLLLEISHVTSMPGIVPAFTNPLEVKLSRNGLNDTIVRLNITDNLDQYYISGIGEVTGIISLDPNNWIINKNGTIIQDPSFIAAVSDIESTTLSIYPNPTENTLYFNELTEGNNVVRILDVRGKEIKCFYLNGSNCIDVSSLANGNYIIEITNNDSQNIAIRKLIKF